MNLKTRASVEQNNKTSIEQDNKTGIKQNSKEVRDLR